MNLNSYLNPSNSRALLPKVHAFCPDEVSFAQMESPFAEIPTPHPYSLISYHILHLGFCKYTTHAFSADPKHPISCSDKIGFSKIYALVEHFLQSRAP